MQNESNTDLINTIAKTNVGLVAGNGTLPIRVLESLNSIKCRVYVASHNGETLPDVIAGSVESITVKVGQINKILNFFKRNGVRSVVFAGGIRRTRLFSNVWLDRRAVKIIAKAGGVRDDEILSCVANEFEREGFSVFAPHSVVPELLVSEGLLTRRDMTREEVENARIGWEAAKRLGSLDIGQGVAVCQGIVIALEAVEGTDAMIKRAGELSGKKPFVVVKLPKPQQDKRMDLPAVGLKTIEILHKSGASALILQSKGAIMLDPQEVITKANATSLAIRVL